MHAVGRRDLAAIAECYTGDAVVVSPVFGEVTGRDAILQSWQKLFSTLTDVAIEVSDVLVDGDRVSVLSRITTTANAGWFGSGIPGSVEYRLVLLLSVRGSQIARDERIYDSAGVVERLEKARLEQDLKIAAEVQRALMGRPAHSGPFFHSVGDSLPCLAIGGDFFEFIDLPHGDAGIMIGDVAGKGPPAALLAALIQGIFGSEAPLHPSPSVVLSRINQRLVDRRVEPRFATLFYCVLSPDGRLVYSSAGHNPPALRTGAGIRCLTAGGPLLGAFRGAAFEEETICLQPGDTLVTYTDGVTEARDPGGEEFGEDRLTTCISDADPAPAPLLHRIFGELRHFCHDAAQSDDITVTVTRFR